MKNDQSEQGFLPTAWFSTSKTIVGLWVLPGRGLCEFVSLWSFTENGASGSMIPGTQGAQTFSRCFLLKCFYFYFTSSLLYFHYLIVSYCNKHPKFVQDIRSFSSQYTFYTTSLLGYLKKDASPGPLTQGTSMDPHYWISETHP